jgi:dephospho-CoA kinase
VLWVGLTGGIGSGKSAVSRRLVQRGAALVDADVVAREVVAAGTPGLAEVVAAFGEQVLRPDGELDREALGRLVFGDDDARRRLNGIVHPRVGERTLALAAGAEAAGAPLLVHDVPLLVENGLAPTYHLVVVVEAPLEDRLHRLTALRGMREEDARARIAAQATDEQRRAVADSLLDNGGSLAQLHAAVDALVDDRLLPYADNLAHGRPAPRSAARSSPGAGDRLVARLRAVCGPRAVAVERASEADAVVTAAGRGDLEALGPVLARAGFPRADDDGGQGVLHRAADPGRPAEVRLRTAGAGPDAAGRSGDSEV